MSNTTISPNMNMPVPTVSQDPGPDWATNVDACLSIVDSHNHSANQGVQITPSGLNINTDLPMNSNNLTTTKSVRFSPLGSPLSGGSDIGCVYESGVDLYYNDGSGNQVRLTQGGSPAGGAGSIGGLPSGTASASFSVSTFIFQSATNTPASMSQGPTKISQAVVSGKGVTVSASGSQASDYSVTLPVALPTTSSSIVSDASGVTSFLALQTGTYSPTLVVSVGTAAAVNPFTYFRIGNNVTVSGLVSGTTAIVSPFGCNFTMSLPVDPTSNFIGSTDVNGMLYINDFNVNQPAFSHSLFRAEVGTKTCRVDARFASNNTGVFLTLNLVYSCA